MFSTELRTFLLTHKSLTDLIGQRLYPGWLPEKPAMPSVAYLEVSGVRFHNIDVAYPRFQFSCFSNRYVEAKQVATEITKALQRFKGDIGGTRVIQCVHEGTYEQYEQDTKLYHVSVDFKIIYREVL